jgi:ATP-binding cassette subfamily B multidrug efflux pump
MKAIELIKPYFVENRVVIFLGFACLILVDFLQLTIPRVIKWAIDDLTNVTATPASLAIYTGYILAIGLMIGIFRYLWRRFLLGTSRRVEEGLRNRLFTHTQNLSASFFDKTRTGDLMAHATNDIQQVRMATGMGLVAINDAIVLGAAAIGFMALINLRLTAFVLIPMPFIVLGTRFFSKKMHLRYRTVQGAFADLTEGVRERFAGIRIIKAYNSEQTEALRLEKISKRYVDENVKLVKITGSFFPMMLLFSNLSLAIVLYLGGRQTIMQEITPGDFVAFISYLGLLTWPMMALGWVTNLIQRGKASLERIDKILQTVPEISDMPDARPQGLPKQGLVLRNLSFAYETAGPRVLSGINLTLEPGTTLGLVGPPGCGKTSLLQLIPRFYDVVEGGIFLDGIDIRSLRLSDLRALIALVPQEPFMFAGTIAENIALGDTTMNGNALENAVKMAALDETVASFPKGLNTLVGEKGVILSGGQKQRIALARALLSNRPILLLDDPISQVDADTGQTIINTIQSLTWPQFTVLSSHRLSAVRQADQIAVLNKGLIVESGSHAELMANDRYYAQTYRLQEISDAP